MKSIESLQNFFAEEIYKSMKVLEEFIIFQIFLIEFWNILIEIVYGYLQLCPHLVVVASIAFFVQ